MIDTNPSIFNNYYILLTLITDHMKLYLVSVDDYDYGEYDAFVVRAENEDAGREHISNMIFEGDYYRDVENRYKWLNESKVKEILVDGDEDIILGSFNAS